MKSCRSGFLGVVKFNDKPLKCWMDPIDDERYEAYTPIGVCIGIFKNDEIEVEKCQTRESPH
jgi:hypothetical protein